MHYVVTGPGYTGRRVLALLSAESAVAIGRSVTDVPSAVRTIACDLDELRDGLPGLVAPYRLLYTVPPSTATDGDERLCRFLSALVPRPERFVYLSTTGVYGDRGGAAVDENDAPAPRSARGHRRLAAEERLHRWSDEHGVALYLLRVPGIYGPGRLGLDRIRERVPVIREEDAGPGNRIHVDDLAACAAQSLQTDAPPGTYNVGDGDHRSSTWFARTVAGCAGLEPPPEVTRREAERTFSAARLSFLKESRRVSVAKMRDVLGFSPRYANAEDGIVASLADEP